MCKQKTELSDLEFRTDISHLYQYQVKSAGFSLADRFRRIFPVNETEKFEVV